MSFSNLLREGAAARIEIPIIQRDYAQGRKDPATTRIRGAFLEVLRQALTDNQTVSLDFVYGELLGDRLIPFDGQQRLTTLFLLHWYLAARSALPDEECSFLAGFTYRTRFSARHFCANLVSQRPPFLMSPVVENNPNWLSHWLTDQHWYAGAWKHDPTIQSMLVTLDDIHQRFGKEPAHRCRDYWDRLVDCEQPRITFDFLSLQDIGRPDELYIKMNSRGKPLTRFEHFKAEFETTLGAVSTANRDTFARKIDQDWSDLLWPLRNSRTGQSLDDTIIDDEFLRLFHFISDIVSHRQGLQVNSTEFKDNEIAWAKRIYGTANPRAAEAQRDMMLVLDTLYAECKRRDIKNLDGFTRWFDTYFSEQGHQPGRVTIFDKTNLLADCCSNYGQMNGQARAFPLGRSLLLYAFIDHLVWMQTPLEAVHARGEGTEHCDIELPEPDEVARRLRVIRNLIFASENEIRPANFPAQLEEIAAYMRSGHLSVIQTFNKHQIADENNKAALLNQYPENLVLRETLHRLEDHRLLRGCLVAFDLALAPAVFIRRAELFHDVFLDEDNMPAEQICAALLACGDYSQRTRNGRYQFASPLSSRNDTWRGLLTNSTTPHTGTALCALLDKIDVGAPTSVQERLQSVCDAFLTQQEHARRFNWQYYLVKYPAMRRGESGLYVTPEGASMGFDMCMLNRSQLNSNYRDPYLSAIIKHSAVREGDEIQAAWFSGWDCDSSDKRWIRLPHEGDRLFSCRQDGFQLAAPETSTARAMFDTVCHNHRVDDDLVLRVPQVSVDDTVYDETDRVAVAAKLLTALVAGYAAVEPMPVA